MKLSDNEIRDITQYLEAGKPLPEKYRFLLFGDKQEVELVWNSKGGEISQVVLPFQVIDQVDEPRAEAQEGCVSGVLTLTKLNLLFITIMFLLMKKVLKNINRRTLRN